MKIYNKVRGTMQEVRPIDCNIDTVYVRTNITKIEEENFTGWEYDEIQYDLKEFLELKAKENEDLKSQNEQLRTDKDLLAQNVLELTEVVELIVGGLM